MPNTDKEFWNDANVIDFAYSVRHNDNFKDGIALSKGTIDELAKEFKRSKEPKFDYEILSYSYRNKIYTLNSFGEYTLSSIGEATPVHELLLHPENMDKIHSVKRSDGEVFTKNEITGGTNKILDFVISNGNLIIKMTTTGFTNNSYFDTNIQSLTKTTKQPLFTTEDKVDIYEGDEYVKVNDYSDYSIVTGFTAHGNHNDYKGIRFSTKEAANEYVLMNKPCLSLNEVLSCSSYKEVLPDNPHFLKLKELAKQKINGI